MVKALTKAYPDHTICISMKFTKYAHRTSPFIIGYNFYISEAVCIDCDSFKNLQKAVDDILTKKERKAIHEEAIHSSQTQV